MDRNQNIPKSDAAWLKIMKIGKRTGCHQMPERSFYYKEWQFPICARCTGVVIGWLLSVCSIYFYKPNLVVILVLCLTMFLDWFLQYKKICISNNSRRFVTGIMGGYALMCLYIEIIIFIVSIIIKIVN